MSAGHGDAQSPEGAFVDLILWRHAEAVLAHEGLHDHARALTAKGERQAQRMAQWLNQRLAHSTRVLVSPALRTQQTARHLERPLRTLHELAPEASVDALLQASQWPLRHEPVLVVGHQPTLGLVAARLMTGVEAPWSIKKGSVWWLRSREREGVRQVVLHAVQVPELL
jgi:phosphohistidine phosphatase